MNRTLYSLLLWLRLPFEIFKLYKLEKNTSPWKANLIQRIGIVKGAPKGLVWFHCSSLGELNTASALILELLKDHKLLVTTTTKTGAEAVRQIFADKVTHCYFPFDCRSFIKRFLANIKPKACILMETEIWPNLVHELAKQKTPIILINARLSSRSVRRYLKFAPKLIRNTLSHYTLIATQDQIAHQRFLSIGAPKRCLYLAGNIKYSISQILSQNAINEIKDVINNRTTIIFASTHPKEELEIIASLKKYQNQLNALLIIVPRKPERFDEVFARIKKAGFTISRRSYNIPCLDETQVLLGDSMCELSAYFAESSVAFIGGSLDSTGGHNMLEAAEHSIPIIFGPNVANFAEVSHSLLDDDAAIQVQDANELFEQIIDLLGDEKRRNQLGENAHTNLKKYRGTVDKLLELLEPHLGD
jgi:3-deoxy-D-manno-octulosonic-acid transferase